jgi:hypothetical protein
MKAHLILATLLCATSIGNATPLYDDWEIVSTSPVEGKPWVAGTSAFDWSSWSFSDSTLKNNSSATRTWVVPVPTVTFFSSAFDDNYDVQSYTHCVAYSARVRAGSGGETCMQAVFYNSSGVPVSASPSVCASSTSTTWLSTPYVESTTTATAHVVFTVGGGGGRVIYTEALALMYTVGDSFGCDD